ncbi:PAS domain-containing protein [Sphingosinicellaceae bacterium]|nr:PAS domain-containing protein [Sphingosinicellaceae bacterium]
MTTQSANLAVHDAAASADAVLPDRRDLALLAVEKTRMPMVVSDARQADNPIVLANQAFLDLTGYTAGEIIGQNCRFMQGPETSQLALAQIRDDIVNRRDSLVEILNYRKDGSTFWNQLHISPLFDDQGELIYHFASQQDVTRNHDAMTLEAGEIALLREVDHRAKNALALVQGIVRLSRADNASDYAAAVQGRVDALALAHSLLADRRWQAVPLDSLVAGMIRGMGLTQVSAEGPAVGIAPGQVQPLALLLHELLGNALRHGGLSVPEGKLEIVWRPDPGHVAITLSESGGPSPAEDRPPGFGLTVINAVTARQLRGKVSFDWQPTGLTSEVTIPWEASVA